LVFEADLDELCGGLRPNGLPLHWGYVPLLLAIQSKHGIPMRKKYQDPAIKKGWTVPSCVEKFALAGNHGHGRTALLPKNFQDGWTSIIDS